MAERTSRKTWPRWLRISVRSFMLLVLMLGGGLGWIIHKAEVQRGTVAAIESDGGFVVYDWDWKDGSLRLPIHRPGYLSWLENTCRY